MARAVLNSATVFSSATGPLIMRVMALLRPDRLVMARIAMPRASRTVHAKAAASLDLIVKRIVGSDFRKSGMKGKRAALGRAAL